jgi:hypothetical protein
MDRRLRDIENPSISEKLFQKEIDQRDVVVQDLLTSLFVVCSKEELEDAGITTCVCPTCGRTIWISYGKVGFKIEQHKIDCVYNY